ncbi:hypothetical protein [uncultured Sphingomonas sp.]|nr:hypothetical protein [uncultured Sphingomonas sp.]
MPTTARARAPYTRDHNVRVTDTPFNDFAEIGVYRPGIHTLLGLPA